MSSPVGSDSVDLVPGQDEAAGTSEQGVAELSSENEYVKRRSVLKRRFTKVRNALEAEYKKIRPSNRYLVKFLSEAERLNSAIEEVVKQQRKVLELHADEHRLGILNAWEAQYETESELLATVSSYLEQNAPTAFRQFLVSSVDVETMERYSSGRRLETAMAEVNVNPTSPLRQDQDSTADSDESSRPQSNPQSPQSTTPDLSHWTSQVTIDQSVGGVMQSVQVSTPGEFGGGLNSDSTTRSSSLNAPVSQNVSTGVQLHQPFPVHVSSANSVHSGVSPSNSSASQHAVSSQAMNSYTTVQSAFASHVSVGSVPITSRTYAPLTQPTGVIPMASIGNAASSSVAVSVPVMASAQAVVHWVVALPLRVNLVMENTS